MKRKALAFLVCTALVAGMLALTGCSNGNSDKDQISKDLTSQLDSFKSSCSQKLADELKANDASLATFGVDSDELAKALADGFGYKVGDITVNSGANSATAEVTLTSKTAASVLTALTNNVPSAVGSLTLDDLSSEDKINKFVGNQLLEAAKSAGTESTSVTLTYSKNNNTWTMDDLDTQIYKALGLDQISLDSIYRELGVSNAAELDALISQYLPK